MKRQGQISVNSKNMFPIIKKWLYSDKDIFLREIVSNGCDAIKKLESLRGIGQAPDEEGYQPKVIVTIDPDKKQLIVSDNGIGMTEDEVERYITQIAFSGAEDFLEKYKEKSEGDAGIIGHFGLGFYSAFMVSGTVEIQTLSYQEGAKPVHWISSGEEEYEIEDGDRTEHGTTIIMNIAEDEQEFLQEARIHEILHKYCQFMPYEIYLNPHDEERTVYDEEGNPEKNEDGTEKKEIVKPRPVNDTHPLWLKAPKDCTDEEYKEFYHKVFMDFNEPLFWIHLNVDYPFNLTGILYFPRIKSNIELQRNKIQLYCNQVFVTDQVEGIVPEFLTLLHGVIDSPDIPLNVSRSYLQSDANVKKISKYITKKVADRLAAIFKENRKDYEEKWDDLKIFIHYGMLSQDDFYDRAKDFALLKDVDGKYFTYEEYQTLIKDNQTDKEGNLVYLYANDKEGEYSYIEAAKAKGYSVLLLDGQLDNPMVSMLEQKLEKTRFSRVDADIVDRLIQKDDKKESELAKDEKDNLEQTFRSQLPKMEKTEFYVDVQALGDQTLPVLITQSEYMRRMKEASKFQAGMAFYAQMPDTFNLVLNSDHPLIKQVLEDGKTACATELQPVESELKGLEARLAALHQSQNGKKKQEEISQEEKDDVKNTESALEEQRTKKNNIIATYAAGNKVVHQLIDLALLQNGMLKGAALDSFLKRSVDLIK